MRAVSDTRPILLLIVGTTLKVPGAVKFVDRLLRPVRLFADGGITAWLE